MVTFLPFAGYRPNLSNGEHEVDRISPPYDVISDDYLKELQSHPHNVTNLTLKQDGTRDTIPPGRNWTLGSSPAF